MKLAMLLTAAMLLTGCGSTISSVNSPADMNTERNAVYVFNLKINGNPFTEAKLREMSEAEQGVYTDAFNSRLKGVSAHKDGYFVVTFPVPAANRAMGFEAFYQIKGDTTEFTPGYSCQTTESFVMKPLAPGIYYGGDLSLFSDGDTLTYRIEDNREAAQRYFQQRFAGLAEKALKPSLIFTVDHKVTCGGPQFIYIQV